MKKAQQGCYWDWLGAMEIVYLSVPHRTPLEREESTSIPE
jgi:hypothetical protein